MNKQELVAHVADAAGITRKQAQAAVDAIFDADSGAICSTLKGGGKFSVAGFGSFSARERAARTGRNPRTGKEIKIAASRSAGFTAGKGLKDSLNG